MNHRPKAIDLFCGAGGMSLGLEQAGFDVIAAVDSDPIHCATHEYNFPNCLTLCRDINLLTGTELRRATRIGDRPIDLVAGGPPCQSFSVMGFRQLDDPRSNLIFHFARLVAELGANYFIMENVPGLAATETSQLLTQLLEQLQTAGYEVRSPMILNAAGYGVPQNRRRLFLVGCRKGLQLPEWPTLTTWTPNAQLKATVGERFELPTTPTVWDAIADLPEVEEYPELLDRDSVKPENHWRTQGEYAAMSRWGGWNRDKRDFSYPRRFSYRTLTSSRRSQHDSESRKRFQQTEWGKREPISHFHKLDPQGLSPTLRAGTGSDRGSHTAPRPIHPYTPRCITVREGARLHSFPDWFRFHATIWHGFRQVGNSVPPLLARAVAAEVIRALGCTPLKPELWIELGSEELLCVTRSKAQCQQLSLF